jgi:hypothetical protein
MTGTELRSLLLKLLPDTLLGELAIATGLQRRQRKLDPRALVRTLVIASSTPAGGRQADLLRHYLEASGAALVRGSFYDRFSTPLELTLDGLSLALRALAASRSVDLPPALRVERDWCIVDSTTVRLPAPLRREYPGAGAYAAVKVHKTLSVGRGMLVDYHFSPARHHDSPHFVVDESWRGMGLLMDLGYASLARLAGCQRHGVSVVMRLKQRWCPTIARVARADLERPFVRGEKLGSFLDRVRVDLRNPIDVDATVGDGLGMRLVGVAVPGARHRFYLTNLPRRIGPHQVADLYRVRWEIETNNKLDKSGQRLHDIAARRPTTARALLHASLLGSMVVGALVHSHNVATRPAHGARLTPPLHHGLVARTMSMAAGRIVRAFDLCGSAANREWAALAQLLSHTGIDPNWRSKPSILDQLRGWPPGPPRHPRLSSRVRP